MSFKNAALTWQHRLWGHGDVNRNLITEFSFYGDKGSIVADDSKI